MLYHFVGHDADPDGICSHAIFKRWADNQGHTIKHHYADYPNLLESIEGLLEQSPGKVIIADLTLNGEIQNPSLFRQLRARHSEIEYYDHHQASIDNREMLEQYCITVGLAANKCAAQLILEQYGDPNDDYTIFLSELSRIHDFERTDEALAETAYALQDLIAAGSFLPKLVNDLADTSAWHDWKRGVFNVDYQEILDSFEEKKTRAYATMEQSVELCDINGFSVLTAFSENVLYAKLAPSFLAEKYLTPHGPANFIFVLYDEIPNVFCVGDRTIGKDTLLFSEQYGGGGRGHRGGFVIDHVVTLETYQKDKEDMLDRFAEYFHNSAA